ncbi:MAG: hypothetical protein LBQ57_04800 [Spirochaetales bacterium]|jgi:hypothetical protein|nr:hypothetical protein [Spirochaetales bacterium]
MSAPEIAVKAASTLHAEKQNSWLQRNCEAIALLVISRPHISVKASSPHRRGKWRRKLR